MLDPRIFADETPPTAKERIERWLEARRQYLLDQWHARIHSRKPDNDDDLPRMWRDQGE